MRLLHDVVLQRIFLGALLLLGVATVVGQILAHAPKHRASPSVANLNARIYSWWVIFVVLSMALLSGNIASVVLFAIISFLALREFITLTPTDPRDHRALLWVFFIFTPLQYALVAIRWYGMFSIMIPVYAFLILAIRMVLSGETANFLGRIATVQWALMICVYCVSYAPALLTLDIPGFHDQGLNLLLFLIIIAQLSDVFQYIVGKLAGRHRIVPNISPNKTWEGFFGGLACATLLGAGMWWATPFTWWQSGLQALVVALMGFAGGLVMSAVKRDKGVKDFGRFVKGHGGILDRIDSLTFAAPVFFHLTRFFFHG